MSVENQKQTEDKLAYQQLRQIRREEGQRIDPETAEVTWWFGEISDPYGVGPAPEAGYCIGRLYFARSPGSEIWVSFDHLPEETRNRIWMRGPKIWEDEIDFG